MKYIELEFSGISAEPFKNDKHVLVLSEKGGSRHLPILISSSQVHIINTAMEKMPSVRPTTYDLFKNIMQGFNITLEEVFIYNIQEGIFRAGLTFKNKNKYKDEMMYADEAVTLALCLQKPIYTYEVILKCAGIILNSTKLKPNATFLSNKISLEHLDITTLEQMLKDVIEQEDYRKAVAIRDEINNRKLVK